MPWGTRLAALSTLALLTLASPLALAQSDDERAAARAAATDGVTALEQGRFKDAVDLFKRAESIIHAPPHLLYMARAQVKLGNLVSAHETYLKVTRETLAEGAPRAFTEAQETAAAELAALEPRIPSLKVDVVGAPAGEIELLVDGAPAPAATIGLARPIDPGMHKIQARTKTATSKIASVTVAEGAKESLSLVLATGAAEPLVNEPPPPDAPQKKGSGARTGAYVAFGVGAAGLVVGIISLLQNHSKRDDASALCVGGPCPASKRAEIEGLDDDASAAATRAWIGYGVGVVGVGVGAVLLLTSGSSDESKAASRRTRPSAWLGPRGGGLGLEGKF
jgi:microcompartment protein CcmK/EutM